MNGAPASLDASLRYPVILFDLGSTLIYFDNRWPTVFLDSNQALLEHLCSVGVNLPQDSFDQDFKARLDTYYAPGNTEFIEYTLAYILGELLADRGFPNLDEAVLRGALAAWHEVNEVYWKCEADTLPVLQRLLSQGYRLGMVSNTGDDTSVQRLVDEQGLRPFFDIILTSAAQGIRKPNPLIFHTALRQWGARPEQAVMVGDTLGADILGAHNAGMRGIWITRRADTVANRAHLETVIPDAVIQQLSELPDLLPVLD